jgi:hypothetical protein
MNATAASLREGLGRASGLIGLVGVLVGCSCCGGVKPPPSQFPTGQAAVDRMKATFECARGVRGDAKLDFKADRGRLRGNLLFYAVEPASVRFDVVSPFGVALATLTSDSQRFAFSDLREKKFLFGPASACNIARMTQLPIPGHALVRLLHGEAPLLVHQPEQPTITWNTTSPGFFVVEVPSTRGARQVIHLAPTPEDFGKPWSEQRVRVLDLRVIQQDIELYHATFDEHKLAKIGEPMVDDEGLDPPIPPIGPACSVEIPRRIHVAVTPTDDDVQFRYEEVVVNPAVPPGIFSQPIPGGMQRVPVGECDK